MLSFQQECEMLDKMQIKNVVQTFKASKEVCISIKMYWCGWGLIHTEPLGTPKLVSVLFIKCEKSPE